LLSNAHECPSAVVIAIALEMFLTTTGDDDLVKAPLPNSPTSLAPQHLTLPSAASAHELLPPAETAIEFARPSTTTGVGELVVVPLPSWPLVLSPQQATVPSSITAHEWFNPVASVCAEASPLFKRTTTGVEEFVVVPLPS